MGAVPSVDQFPDWYHYSWFRLYHSAPSKMTDQHNLDFQIANTLEKIQHINPVLYGMWYSKLYPPHGDNKHWTAETLTHLNNLLK